MNSEMHSNSQEYSHQCSGWILNKGPRGGRERNNGLWYGSRWTYHYKVLQYVTVITGFIQHILTFTQLSRAWLKRSGIKGQECTPGLQTIYTINPDLGKEENRFGLLDFCCFLKAVIYLTGSFPFLRALKFYGCTDLDILYLRINHFFKSLNWSGII